MRLVCESFGFSYEMAGKQPSWLPAALDLVARRLLSRLSDNPEFKLTDLHMVVNNMVQTRVLTKPGTLKFQAYLAALSNALRTDTRFVVEGNVLRSRAHPQGSSAAPQVSNPVPMPPLMPAVRATGSTVATTRSSVVQGATVPSAIPATYEELHAAAEEHGDDEHEMAPRTGTAEVAHDAAGSDSDADVDEEESESATSHPEAIENGQGTETTQSAIQAVGQQQLLRDYFFSGPQNASKALTHGYALGDEASAARFAEAALLGCEVDDGDSCTSEDLAISSAAASTSSARPIYLNTHEPFCVATVGVQGGGKSHTLACVLESCLVPFQEKAADIVRLKTPMSALVLHYDQNVTSVCEATGLIGPVPKLARMVSGVQPASARCLPREKMVVLVSPSYYKQRKAFYGSYCEVKPLLFQWATLTADHIKRIMRLKDNDSQLYVATMMDMLRRYQRGGGTPTFRAFLEEVTQQCNLKGQEGPLSQRLRLLESVVAESSINAGLAAVGADLYSSVKPGMLVVADLTDPLLSSEEANGVFQVLTEQYRALPMIKCGSGKVLALDEAHKFLDATSIATDGLSQAIVNVARLMRHDGMRLVVSTQSPRALAPELLELVTTAIMHRFHSRDWFTYLCQKLPLPDSSWGKLMALEPGEALVFASRIARQSAYSIARHVSLGQDELSRASHGHVMHVRIRPRITADRGATKSNT